MPREPRRDRDAAPHMAPPPRGSLSVRSGPPPPQSMARGRDRTPPRVADRERATTPPAGSRGGPPLSRAEPPRAEQSKGALASRMGIVPAAAASAPPSSAAPASLPPTRSDPSAPAAPADATDSKKRSASGTSRSAPLSRSRDWLAADTPPFPFDRARRHAARTATAHHPSRGQRRPLRRHQRPSWRRQPALSLADERTVASLGYDVFRPMRPKFLRLMQTLRPRAVLVRHRGVSLLGARGSGAERDLQGSKLIGACSYSA